MDNFKYTQKILDNCNRLCNTQIGVNEFIALFTGSGASHNKLVEKFFAHIDIFHTYRFLDECNFSKNQLYSVYFNHPEYHCEKFSDICKIYKVAEGAQKTWGDHPYPEIALDSVMENIGYMCMLAVHDFGCTVEEMIADFVESRLSLGLEVFDERIVYGMTPEELFNTTRKRLGKDGIHEKIPPIDFTYYEEPDEYFWAGMMLALYQFERNTTYYRLYLDGIPEFLVTLYMPFHEMSEQHTLDAIDRKRGIIVAPANNLVI